MDKLTLEQLRRTPIEGVAERLGLEVRRHKCLCFMHNDHHASLSFDVRRNTFRCWSCGEHGGVIDMVMRRLGLGFVDACRWLQGDCCALPPQTHTTQTPVRLTAFDAARYSRFFERPWLSPAAKRFLFEERLIDPRVVRWCRLASWRDREGIEWLQIPFFDLQGRLTGVQNRNLTPGGQPRFRFPVGSVCGVYNLPIAARLHEGDQLFIAEGVTDCLALLSAGRKAVAVPSATLLTPAVSRQLKELDGFKPAWQMYPDADEPGERLYLQLCALLPTLTRHQLPQGCKDFSDYYRSTRRKEAAV